MFVARHAHVGTRECDPAPAIETGPRRPESPTDKATGMQTVKAWSFAASVAFLIAVALPLGGIGHSKAQSGASEPNGIPASNAAPTPGANPNAFNRLLTTPITVNAPPMEDGIHDPESPGTGLLQPPAEAFRPLPKTRAGNHVDWVKAINEGLIQPRAGYDDPEEEAMVMDLDIVREVKGSMPDVVYPHEPHTQWLDCSNCHDDIFIPEKGANQISMAAILLGQKCGVCHGTVAFPVSDCRRCHSKPKSEEQLRALMAN